VRSRWLSRGSVTLHVVVVLAIAAMLGLFWWQLQRALAGNKLSWAYAVEWPLFAVYAVYMWWRLLHEQPEFADTKSVVRRTARAERKQQEADARAVAEEAELAAYNEYLSRLSSERRSAEQ
jgi:hypothetical protein